MAVVLKGKPLLVYRDYWLLALNVVPCQRPVKRKQDSTMQCGHGAVQWTMSYILIISRFRVVHCGIFYGPLFFLGIVYTRAFGKIKTQNIPRLAYILHTFYHDYYHYEPSHLVYHLVHGGIPIVFISIHGVVTQLVNVSFFCVPVHEDTTRNWFPSFVRLTVWRSKETIV